MHNKNMGVPESRIKASEREFFGDPRKIAALLMASLFIFLSGCGFDSSIDSLLSPPVISEHQQEIYSALASAVGKDIIFVYPRSGNYRSAFVFCDLDGDETDEAAVFYKPLSDSEGSVRVNILKNDGEKWRSLYDHAGAGTSIETIYFTVLGSNPAVRMAIGYGYMTPTEKTLKIYSLKDGILENEYTETYYKTLTLDLDSDGGRDIAVINCNNENHTAALSLVTDKGNGVVCTGTVELNSSSADISSAKGGYIGSETPAVFIDELMSSGNLSTEIIYCVNGELRNPAIIDGSELSSKTLRQQGLYSTDIDGDGIIEIPEREPFLGYRDQQDSQYMTNWNVFEDYSAVKKYSSLTDPSSGYAFMIPPRWEGKVTVKNDRTTGEKVFYKFNMNLRESRLELMRILVCSHETAGQKLTEGYTLVTSSDSAVYLVRFGDTDDSLLLTAAEVTGNFYLYQT